MKISLSVICAALLLASLPFSAAEQGGKIAVRLLSVVENRANNMSGKDDDFGFMPGLTLALELSGPPIVKSTHWGKLAIAKAVDDRDAALELREEPSEEFREILRVPTFSFGNDPAPAKPDDKIRIELTFKTSARAATAIKALEGSLAVRVAEKKEVFVAAPAKLVGKPIDDRTLKAAGASLQVTQFTPDGPEYAKFSAQDREGKIAELDIVDAKGKSLVNSRGSSSFDDGSGKKEFSLGGDGKLPPDARLKITVTTSRADLPVPFRFENVQLP